MNLLHTRNVHSALPKAVALLEAAGVRRPSRNGDVLMCSSPVTTVYERPRERVMFWAERDANPFFHFYESLWMLAGRDDIKPLSYIVGRMASFSDDGVTMHGAYGHRWRQRFSVDQLAIVVRRLRENPDDRRQVIQMWDAQLDLGHTGKDVPCNVTATVQINTEGALDLAVFNRSNDIVWGCYGANAVHFSMLQEYLARAIGVPTGQYYQISVNWHGYIATFEPLRDALYANGVPEANDPYASGEVEPYPLMQVSQQQWDIDLRHFLNVFNGTNVAGTWGKVEDPFFSRVAAPIMNAHHHFKNDAPPGRFEEALRAIERCEATDWRRACTEWLTRRYNRWNVEVDDGPAPR